MIFFLNPLLHMSYSPEKNDKNWISWKLNSVVILAKSLVENRCREPNSEWDSLFRSKKWSLIAERNAVELVRYLKQTKITQWTTFQITLNFLEAAPSSLRLCTSALVYIPMVSENHSNGLVPWQYRLKCLLCLKVILQTIRWLWIRLMKTFRH